MYEVETSNTIPPTTAAISVFCKSALDPLFRLLFMQVEIAVSWLSLTPSTLLLFPLHDFRLQAERNRNMGQRRREVREELERRENAVVNGSSSSGLGAGGEARVAAAKLDELRKQGDAKREQQSRARSAAWDLARDSAKKRRTSPGLSEGGSAATEKDDLEARTVRVKWSTKKESHSDHTLDVLFSKFGAVESVSIELGTGNRALVTFDSPQSADAAVAAYPDGKNMIARYVGKRRPKKSAFAPRRHTMSPTVSGRGGGSGAGSGEERTVNSFRDRESLVMMKMRQEAERRALLRKMAEEEGFAVPGPPGTANRGASAAVAPAGRVDGTRDIGGSGSAGPGASSGSEANATPAKPVTTATRGGEGDGVDGVYSMVNVREMEEGGGGSGTPVAAGAGTDSSGSAFSAATGIGKPAFPFATPVRPTRDVAARRKSDIPPATTNGGVGGGKSFVSSANFSASVGKIAANNPESDRAAGGGLINENDILARMMAMKR